MLGMTELNYFLQYVAQKRRKFLVSGGNKTGFFNYRKNVKTAANFKVLAFILFL